MSKLSDAAFAIMQARKGREISTKDLWVALRAAAPELTETTAARKTPRTTAMRDVKKDPRFVSAAGKVTLSGETKR